MKHTPSWIVSHLLLVSLGASVAFAPLLLAQGSAAIDGQVRDAQGHAPAVSTISLQQKKTGATFTSHTDVSGKYHIGGLAAGEYLLILKSTAPADAITRAVVLGDGESKKIDLTIQYGFYDQPNFIVAGVTDPTVRGGHGSDTVLRSSEALNKATASLAESAGSPNSGSEAAQHHALAAAAEKKGDALQAQREYQRAAELDPSEGNLFDWGTELLMHRAAEPAVEVFDKGYRLYPQSLRLLLGMAAACYARGSYDRAAEFFFAACDLNPDDPTPYLFLGKIQSGEITRLPGYVDRLARFAKLHPDNAWANYYYAIGLWKQRSGPDDSQTPVRVRELLQTAIRINPTMASAYLQLGIVFAETNEDDKAVGAFDKAIAIDPHLEEAHYRLGQVYGRLGQKLKAQQELETYERMSRQSQEETERTRRDIPQFVFELRDKNAPQ